MKPSLIGGILIFLASTLGADETTPVVGQVAPLRGENGGTLGFFARIESERGDMLGFAIDCMDANPRLTIYLGAFPPKRQALQLSTRTADGTDKQYGDPFLADARSGYHSPQLAGSDFSTFMSDLLTPGVIVSNRWNSYQVNLSSTERNQLIAFSTECGRPE